MDEEADQDIGRVVGFQTDDMMYIATIISIDDNADQFTVRTEDGQELTGPLDAVFLDPEKRMDVLNERYEPLGGGKFREKQREATSNWTPVADPSLRAIAMTVGKIAGAILAIGMLITVFSFGAILTQIDSGNWEEVQGVVVEAYEGQDCSTDSDGTTSCSSYTSVTVAYTYEGENYTTKDYSALSDDWYNTADYWLNKASVSVYVNPEQPSQAFHIQGWDGVLEGAFVLFFFTGIILGGYVFVVVPVWFVYAKIQRLAGIKAPGKSKRETDELSTDGETGDNKGEDDPSNASQDTNPAQAGEDTADDAAPVGDAKLQEEKFW
tara:strand:- start:363 stop:1331 length:969 start_codon:yes stop_codon:yes gene_type:complete